MPIRAAAYADPSLENIKTMLCLTADADASDEMMKSGFGVTELADRPALGVIADANWSDEIIKPALGVPERQFAFLF